MFYWVCSVDVFGCIDIDYTISNLGHPPSFKESVGPSIPAHLLPDHSSNLYLVLSTHANIKRWRQRLRRRPAHYHCLHFYDTNTRKIDDKMETFVWRQAPFSIGNKDRAAVDCTPFAGPHVPGLYRSAYQTTMTVQDRSGNYTVCSWPWASTITNKGDKK